MNVKCVSVVRSITDLHFCFVDISCTLLFHLHQVYVRLYLDKCLFKVPWLSQELYFAKWLMKHRFIKPTMRREVN